MLIQFNEIKKEAVITTNSCGAVTKKGVGFDLTHNKKRTIDEYTLIKVNSFNFFTKKVIITCVKGTEQYQAEVDIDFLVSHCALETPDQNRDVQAVLIQHIAHNLLDRETAIFIIVMVLTYLCGLLLGKII